MSTYPIVTPMATSRYAASRSKNGVALIPRAGIRNAMRGYSGDPMRVSAKPCSGIEISLIAGPLRSSGGVPAPPRSGGRPCRRPWPSVGSARRRNGPPACRAAAARNHCSHRQAGGVAAGRPTDRTCSRHRCSSRRCSSGCRNCARCRRNCNPRNCTDHRYTPGSRRWWT